VLADDPLPDLRCSAANRGPKFKSRMTVAAYVDGVRYRPLAVVSVSAEEPGAGHYVNVKETRCEVASAFPCNDRRRPDVASVSVAML